MLPVLPAGPEAAASFWTTLAGQRGQACGLPVALAACLPTYRSPSRSFRLDILLHGHNPDSKKRQRLTVSCHRRSPPSPRKTSGCRPLPARTLHHAIASRPDSPRPMSGSSAAFRSIAPALICARISSRRPEHLRLRAGQGERQRGECKGTENRQRAVHGSCLSRFSAPPLRPEICHKSLTAVKF